jgi:hypothetical protein
MSMVVPVQVPDVLSWQKKNRSGPLRCLPRSLISSINMLGQVDYQSLKPLNLSSSLVFSSVSQHLAGRSLPGLVMPFGEDKRSVNGFVPDPSPVSAQAT